MYEIFLALQTTVLFVYGSLQCQDIIKITNCKKNKLNYDADINLCKFSYIITAIFNAYHSPVRADVKRTNSFEHGNFNENLVPSWFLPCEVGYVSNSILIVVIIQ